MKKRSILLMLVAVALLAASPVRAAEDKTIVIGGKNYVEQNILPELAAALLEKEGFDVTLKTGVASTVLRKSHLNGQVDLYYEYTGTAYTIFYRGKDRDVMTDSVRSYEWVKDHDAAKGLIWLDPVNFNNTYTIMLRGDDARRLGITTISGLGAYVQENPKELVFAMSGEDWERPDAFRGVMRTYGFRVPASRVKKMAAGLCYLAMKNKDVDAGIGYSTDSRIAAFDLVNLEDDKSFFPDYHPCPVVRKDVLDRYPEIADILRPMASRLDAGTMQKLNAQVAIDHRHQRDVARDWLKSEGLL